MSATPHNSAPGAMSLSSLFVSALFILGATAQSSCDINDQESDASIVAADGWSYRLVATGLSSPRGILFDTEGAMLVVEQGSGSISHVSLEDRNGTCLRVRDSTTLIDDEDLNHGIALSEDGRTLYASTQSEVYSWSYDASGPSVDTGSRRTLVNNMASMGGHSTRTLLLSRKNPDMLLVSLGSMSNEDPAALNRDTGVSQIRAFNISALGENDDPYDYTSDGTIMGWGLRNSVGIAEHPETGGIFSVENSVDNIARDGDDIHQNNPGEEMNFHGYLNGSDESQGGNYGYPLCYTLWDTDGFPNRGDLSVGNQFPADWDDAPSNVTIPTDAQCNDDYVAPVMPFEAHTAPLDITFNENGTTAYVSFHGSWNRDEPAGYQISSISFDRTGGQPSANSDDTSAATPIISNENLSDCPDSCFRPVGLAWDSTGRLWFSSDSTGEIFVLQRDGSNNGGGSDGGNGGSGDNGGDGDEGAASRVGKSSWVGLVLAVAVAVASSLV